MVVDSVLIQDIGCEAFTELVPDYKNLFVGVKGVFDHFSYFVVDFEKDPISYNDDWSHLTDIDMSIDNFIDNLVNTAKKRFHFTNFFI